MFAEMFKHHHTNEVKSYCVYCMECFFPLHDTEKKN